MPSADALGDLCKARCALDDNLEAVMDFQDCCKRGDFVAADGARLRATTSLEAYLDYLGQAWRELLK